MQALLDTESQKMSLSVVIVCKYSYYKKLQPVEIDILAAGQQSCTILGAFRLTVEIRSSKFEWSLLIIEDLGCPYILGTDFLKFSSTKVDFIEIPQFLKI